MAQNVSLFTEAKPDNLQNVMNQLVTQINQIPANAFIKNTLGITGTNTLGTSGTIASQEMQYLFAGGNNVTLSQSINGNSGTITIIGANQSVQTQNLIAGIQGGTQTALSGTVIYSNSNNVSFGMSNSSVITASASFNQTVESQSFGVSNIGNTIGTSGIASGGNLQFILAGGNNVTLSQSLNGASGTITISAANQTAQTANVVVPTAGTQTATSGTVAFSNSNNVSFGMTNSSIITASASFNQTVESQSAGISNLGNTSGTTGIASGGQVRLLFAGGNNVTLSQSVNGASATITVSAANQTVQTSNIVIPSAGTQSATSGTVIFSNSNNVTFGMTNSSIITASASFNQTVESQSGGISNLGNTAGTSGIASGAQMRLLFAGGNNVTLSQSVNGASATITVSAFNQSLQSYNIISASGNTTGTLTSFTTGTIVVAGGNNITLSQSSNTITFNAFQSQLTFTLSAGTTLAIGDLCYLGTAATVALKADARSAASASGMLVVPLQTLSSNATGSFLFQGISTATGGLVPGAVYYAGSTAGSITTVAPTSQSQIVRIIGYALNASSLYFNPGNDFIALT